MQLKIKKKLERLYKALATTDEKTVFTLKSLEKGINKLKGDLAEVKKRPVSEVKEILIDTPSQPFDTKELDKKIADLEESFTRTVVSLQENLIATPDYKKEIEDLTKEIETLKLDIITRLANLGGGSANQKISVNGTWATSRYADINIVNPGATVANDDTTKTTKITLAGGTETDPVFTAHPAFGLTSDDMTDIGNLSGTNTGDQDLSGYVPYTGATGAVNLGAQNLTTTGTITGGTGVFNGMLKNYIGNPAYYTPNTDYPIIALADLRGFGHGRLDFYTYGSTEVPQTIPTVRWEGIDTGSFTGRHAFWVAESGGVTGNNPIHEMFNITKDGIGIGSQSRVFMTTFALGAQEIDIAYTLPLTLGSAGEVLTDVAGNGVLSWETPFGSASFQIDASGGTSDTYGELGGAVNSSNKVYTTSLEKYISGSLKVWLNGQLQTQGSGEDWVETTPASGTFTFATAPKTGDEIIVSYQALENTVGNADTVDGLHASAFLLNDNVPDLTHATDSDWTLNNSAENRDILVKINDGGTTRTAIQINGTEGSVTMPRQSYVLATLTSAQTIANNTGTAIVFGNEIADTLGEYDHTTGVFTAKNAGKYLVTSVLTWTNADSGKVYENIISDGTNLIRTSSIITAAASRLPVVNTATVSLSAGGKISIVAYQASGGNEDVYGDASLIRTHLSITKVA